MAKATIVFGLMLCVVTLVALLNIQAGRITTAFIPIVFGIPIFICGIISLNPHRARVWLRVAGFIATIGACGSLFRLGVIAKKWMAGTALYPVPVAITISLLLLLVIYAVAAFRHARKRAPE